MPSYKLTYFNGRGRGEQSRMILAAAGIEFEDNRLEGEDFVKFRPKTTFGQLPVFEVDDVMLCQSNSIGRYIARLGGLAGKDNMEQAKVDMIMEGVSPILDKSSSAVMGEDPAKMAECKKDFEENYAPKYFTNLEKLAGDKGYFVGDQLTAADIAFFANYETVSSYGLAMPSLDKFPKLKKVIDNVKANPKIAKWMKDRPESAW